MKTNKFSSLKEAIKERRAGTGEGIQPTPPGGMEPQPERAGAARPQQRRRGRPKGKRSDPSFQQITLYMPSSLYLSVQDKLKTRKRVSGYQGPRDMSELVAALVAGWNEEKPGHG